MKKSEINRCLYAFKAILTGLFTAQAVGTVHVYLSNKALLKSMQLVQKAGYLAVPNKHVWPALQELGPAFWGGLFFTLSIGTGLSVIALLGGWSWDRLFGRSKIALTIYMLLWLAGIGFVNSNGFSAMATAYLLFVPPVVFLGVLRWLPAKQDKADRMHQVLFLAVPVLLLITWLPIAQSHVFLDIRDNVLLTNSLGRKINDFYYDYTLYAAQAIKPLEQKTIKTCSLTLAENESHRSAIENIFLSHDYLVLDDKALVDLTVKEQEEKLLFFHSNKMIVTTTMQEFAADPVAVFSEFSSRTDQSKPLRLVALGSLMTGSPICLYIILHGLFLLGLSLVLKPEKAGKVAIILCFILVIAVALPLYIDKKQNVALGNLNQALQSGIWQERVAALRYMSDKSLSNDQVAEDYQNWLASSNVAERYWYARTLGANKNPAAGKALLTALDDPSTNVVCMAYYSLGRRGDASVIVEIKNRMKNTSKWYKQLYAYQALRALGWQQAK
jgi:hypothetical protein